MSQAGANSNNGSGANVVETLTGNSGGAVGADAIFNIDVLGNNATGIDIVGTPASNLLTVIGLQASDTQQGTVELATDAETIAYVSTSLAITPSNLTAAFASPEPIGATTPNSGNFTIVDVDNLQLNGNIFSSTDVNGNISLEPNGTGAVVLPNNNLYVGSGAPSNPYNIAIEDSVAGAIGESIQNTSVSASAAATLQIIVEPATADPYTLYNVNGAATYSVGIDNSDSDQLKITTGSTPSGGTTAINITSAGVVTLPAAPLDVPSGGTGLATITDHSVLIGSGTGAITPVGPVAATGAFLASNGVGSDPGFSTATYPLTTTINEILYSSAANTVSGLAAANQAVLTSGATGIPVMTALANDGELIIGSTAGVPAAGSITSTGASVTVTPGSNTINLEVAGTVSSSFPTDGGTATPAAGALTIAGGTGITTSGAAATVTIDLDSPVTVANGGTGLTTITDHGVMVGSGTAAVTPLAVGTNGQLLVGSTGADPVFATVTSSDSLLTLTGGAGTLDIVAQNAVSASAVLTNDLVVRGDGGARGVQTSTVSITDNGEMTNTSQPAFLAYVNTTITNVTGDGTNYTIIPDTEVFDQNSDFNLGTGTFVAPVTGKYAFQFQCTVEGGSGITGNACTLATSNRTYRQYGSLIIGTTTAGMNLMTVLTDMDATDSCTFTVICSDSGGKVVDVSGLNSTRPQTFMSGSLIC